MSDPLLASLSANFNWVDWTVVAVYLIFTTALGARMAGKQSTMRDFFLGGRKLPWFAVSGSIIATEISALTFIIVPFIVFKPGGDFTYLQMGLFGTFFARLLIAWFVIPAYYKREIYSPYDYMGAQLGGNVRTMTTALFLLGGLLAQSARVYLTALVLEVVLHDQLAALSAAINVPSLALAIIAMGIVAIAWTFIGGITTVIWTDAMLFVLFLVGAFVALGVVINELNGGFNELIQAGWQTRSTDHWWDWGKFTYFDFTTAYPDLWTKPYTTWAAVIAATWGSLHPYGTDQLIVQRMFCCKNKRDAQLAMITSVSSQIVTCLVAFVGIGLYAYYQQHPLEGDALAMYQEKGDRIFPIFIVQAIPNGWAGLILAGVFAAAISSLTSILAALSQTFISAFYLPLKKRLSTPTAEASELEVEHDEENTVLLSRLLVIFWGAALCFLAYYAQYAAEKYPSILDLGLALAGYAGGALLAGFTLGFLPFKVDGRGYMHAAPLSVLYIFALVWHADWTHQVCWICAGLILVGWVVQLIIDASRKQAQPLVLPAFVQTLLLLAGIAGMLYLNWHGYFAEGEPDRFGNPTFTTIAWPWYVPIGSTVGVVFGYLLARRKAQDSEPTGETLAVQPT